MYFLKISSVISKLLFLIIVIPQLDKGGFGDYYYIVTIALIISRLISFSNEEFIPLNKKGESNENVFFTFYLIIAFFNLLSFFLSFFIVESYIYILSLSLSIASSVTLGGMIRVNNPKGYSFLSNFPFLLYLLILTQVNNIEISVLMSSFSFAFIMCQLIFIPSLFRCYSFSSLYDINKVYFTYEAIKVWGGKTLSNIFVIANLRVVVIAAYITGNGSDQLAIALTIAEVFWQLMMVWVEKKYSFCMLTVRYIETYVKLIKQFFVLIIIALLLLFFGYSLIKVEKFNLVIASYIPIDLRYINVYLSGGVMAIGFTFLSFARIVIFSLEKFHSFKVSSFYMFQAATFFALLLIVTLLFFIYPNPIYLFLCQALIFITLSLTFLYISLGKTFR